MSKGRNSIARSCGILAAFLFCSSIVALGGVQPVSLLDSGVEPPVGGNGDSMMPILSADGRCVLFASTANNLLLATNNSPIPPSFPARLNVFLRDRTNGIPTLVSVNLTGVAGGNGDSLPAAISTNGQFALFESRAGDLAPSDTNNATDVFLRDLVNEITTLVSVGTNGEAGNGGCRGSVMTPDGRFVAFVSAANNLVANDTNGIPDVYVRDLVAQTTTLVSTGATPRLNSSLPPSTSESPAITPDGRFVAFYSSATNLALGATNASEIYVRDLQSNTTVWASASARTNAQAAQLGTSVVSHNHAISDDGQFVAFEVSSSQSTTANRGIALRYNITSGLTDLLHTNATVSSGLPEDMRSLDMSADGRFIAFVANTNDASGRTSCILVWDAETGTTTLASGTLSNTVPANSICQWPTIDPTGRLVAFLSSATNLTTNTLIGEYHVYVRDFQSGTTTLVDEDRNGFGSGISPATAPMMSADGRFVVFESADANLVANDRNRATDVFVRDLEDGLSELISGHHPDLATVTPNALSSVSAFSASADGYRIAFSSEADNLVANDTNQFRDVFVRDLLAGTNRLVSVATDGHAPGNGPSFDPAMSGDGRYVVFGSSASNLVGGDTNNAQDIFVRDLQTDTTMLVSINANGTGPGNQEASLLASSTNGRYVLFLSRANNLVPGTFPGSNVFQRDLEAGVTRVVNFFSGARSAAMTKDARFVAFSAQTGGVFVWDSQSATRVHTNSATGVSSLAISSSGRLVYVATTTGLSAADWFTHTNWVIANGLSGSHPGLRFSSDGRFLAYANTAAKVAIDVNSTYDVYLYDFQTGDHLLVSHSVNGTAALGGASDWPDISADGRFVSYRSAATNLVPNDINGLPDIFLYDRQTGINTLLSQSRSGNSSADARSLAPVFSGNGRALLFQSWASDLVALDFNHTSDVFALWLPFTDIVPGDTPGEGPTLFWPATPGRTYRAQYKDNLSDTAWQDVIGTVTISGNTATVTDLAPSLSQRFYRVLTD